MACEILGRAINQRRFERIYAKPVPFLAVRWRRQGGLEIKQRGAVRQIGDVVPASRRPDSDLPWTGPVPAVQRQRLFGRQAPALSEPGLQIRGGKAPERRVPGCALTALFIGPARNIPAFDDFLQEAIGKKALPV